MATEVREPRRTAKKTVSAPSTTPKYKPEQSSQPSPGPAPTPATPDRALSVAQLVNSGRLESSNKTNLVFVANKPLEQESPGLYEDAITLSRVRAALKAASLPAMANNAKVSSGNVTLTALENTQDGTLASAVNSALTTSGVQKVVVNYVPVPDGAGN